MTHAPATKEVEPQAERFQVNPELERALERMPFTAELSFEPFFRELKRITEDSTNERCDQARRLVEGLKGVPELRGPIRSPEVLERHQGAIRLLMSFVFPELMDDEIPGQAYTPFSAGPFFKTQGYRDAFEAPGLDVTTDYGSRSNDHYRGLLLFAYTILYHIHYDAKQNNNVVVKQARDRATGLDRFYVLDYHFRFVDAAYEGRTLPTQEEFSRLLVMEDAEELVRRVPLDGVVFSGFNYIRYVEITELHNLSLLKSELVQPNALSSPERLSRIVERLRSVLQVPDLDAGLTLRYQYMQEHRYCAMRSLLKDFDGGFDSVDETIYGEPVRTRTPLFVPDLTECDCDSDLVGHLRAQGVRSLGLIPLLDGDKVCGLLELTSRRPEEIHPSAARKLDHLLPPLTIAVKREMDEVHSRIERTIKANCTAIHPSVEWRFTDAAYQYLHEQAERGEATFGDIVFEDVHPLYGAMDIRGSSEHRNVAIQADLTEHLDLARDTLARIHEAHPMPIADYYDSVLARFRVSVTDGLNSGDEIGIIDFLQQYVEPFFDHVRDHVPHPHAQDGPEAIEAYYAAMDPRMRIVYRRRKEYEESVALINDTLGAYLDHEEEQAQAMFPHYFEKYKTDGVEYNIYVGQSMTGARRFDDVQLKNLRLWQLRVMCEMARRAEGIVPRMRVPLRTTGLVLVHSSALTIQFRTESKQFEVEGSYNIRYEIIKKRIDKSTVRGTGERLTQPGQLAVIYAQDKEYEEYRRYFEYLADKGFIAPEFEHLELEDLQGVHGLRALRATIPMDARHIDTRH